MSLQPIDLQTMYSQINNVAKQAVHIQQGAQLAENFQQVQFMRRSQEQAQSVQKTNEQTELGNVNQDGRQSFSNQKDREKKERPESEEKDVLDSSRPKEDYLGHHIDILR